MEKLERERKAQEEEERKKQYTEQVAAARIRRENERGRKIGASRDAWLEGDADALPPPPKPFAAHPGRSSSNPEISSSSSSTTLQVSRPFSERRMTSDSSVASIHSGTTVTSKRQDPPRQPPAPSVPSPWSAPPSALTVNSNSRPDSPAGPWMPVSAPPGPMNYGMMGMPLPDPLSMAMFEQGFLRPWIMDPINGGLNGGSNGTLTPPRPLFSFGSSGDSSGSLTPPRFPNSRPPSWASSNEDVRTSMQRLSSGGNGGPIPRPISGAYSSGGSAEDWRKSRSSMFFPSGEDQRNRSQSRSPIDPPTNGYAGSLGRSHLSGGMTRSLRSETNMGSKDQQQPQHRPRTSASSSGSHLRSQGTIQSRSSTHPPPLPTTGIAGSLKGAYGLPEIEGYGSSASLGRKSMHSTRSTEGLNRIPTSGSATKMTGGAGGQERPRMHAHSKSSGAPATQRKSRLFG